MGGYSCLVQGPADLIAGNAGAPADLLIIVLHGLGATNRDLVDVVPMLIEQEPKLSAARIVTVCPGAAGVRWGTRGGRSTSRA
jgi:predicted esterase